MHMFNYFTLCLLLAGIAAADLQAGTVYVATDLNKVLLKKDKKKLVSTLARKTKKIYKANRFKKKSKMDWGEELYIHAQKEAPHLAPTIKKLCLTQRISRSVYKLYKKLRTQGVKFLYATNNGTLFMHELRTMFPHVFNADFISNGLCVDYTAADVVSKPDQRYFEQLVHMINPAHDDIIIFIDDNVDNCNAARAWARTHNTQLHVVHFTSVSALKCELRIMGFAV